MLEINNLSKYKISENKIKKAVQAIFKEFKIDSKTISIALVGERRIKKLNRDYRRKDRATDVLSFIGDDDLLGELVICPQQIIKQSHFQNIGNKKKAVEREFIFILVHGILHLLGMQDDAEKQKQEMISTGNYIIKKYGLYD